MVSLQEFDWRGGEKPYEERGGNQRRWENTSSSCHRGKPTRVLHNLPALGVPSPGARKTHRHHADTGHGERGYLEV